MPDWLDELQEAIAARTLLVEVGEPQDPRQKIIADIRRALTHLNQGEGARHPNIGMMVKAHEMAESAQQGSDCSSETIVVVESALSRHNVIIPLAEVGVNNICFISQFSPAGSYLLANAGRIQKEVVDGGNSTVVLAHKTDRGLINVVWNITALYSPRETREMILQNLHRVEVGSF